MRLFSLLSALLVLGLSSVIDPGGLAASTESALCTVVDQSPSKLTLDLATCAPRSEPVMQEAGVTPARESNSHGGETFSYRTSNRDWVAATAPEGRLAIDSLFPQDRIILIAHGDCAKQCSLVALMVQTAKLAEGEVPHPSWHQLLHWDRDPSGRDVPHVVQDLREFFSANPQVRVVINSHAVVQELPMSAHADRSEQLLKQNHTWGGRHLDPESDIFVALYSVPDGCRDFIPNQKEALLDQFTISPLGAPDQGPANGIMLGSPKIFDSFALRQKLEATGKQLASISPFNQTQITAQYGAFQGVTRDTSYLAAQLTTTPTPGVVGTTNALTGNTVSTANQANTSTTTMQGSCPPGYLPVLASGNAVTCTAIGGTVPFPVSGTTTISNPATNQTVTTVTEPTQQIQTTTPSITGIVPGAPAQNPLTAPSAIGISASDMLDLQTQLSSELTTLQTLLQGASSDQLLLSHQRAFGIRAQTTIGFPISIETPPDFKGAVAEIRVLVLPYKTASTSQPISIVNLLPSQKTYNVAKVTSDAKAFGAGVAVQPISFGVTTGKSKDRLYLAKDTDTVALEYPPAGSISLPRHWFETWFEPAEKPDCRDIPEEVKSVLDKYPNAYEQNSAVMFGWQFRPVLGAATVAAGRRTLFAQLALPESNGIDFSPEVWIQTRWRSYDQKKQVAGRIYQESCHWKFVSDPLALDNPVVIKNVQVSDVGQGFLRFHATGDLLSFAGQMRSGSLNVTPQYFDGYSLEYFQAAKDVLANGDLELLDESMHAQPLVIPAKSPSCSISNQKLLAVPMPDGTSYMHLEYDRQNYKPDPDKDGPQHPLVLIGSDVYGLRDKPLQAPDPTVDSTCVAKEKNSTHCSFVFIASTESVRAARTFLVRDPAWDSQGASGSIRIDPAFTKLEATSKTSSDSGDDSTPAPGCPKQAPVCKPKPAPKPRWFLLSGTNFDPSLRSATILEADVPLNGCKSDSGCLQVLAEGTDGAIKHVSSADIRYATDRSMWLQLTQPAGIHVFWSRPEQSALQWDLSVKKDDKTSITADPAILYVADSRAVTFTGADFSGVKNVTYEGKNLVLPEVPTKSKLIVQVTSDITSKFGHKELLATIVDGGKEKIVALPFEVVKH